MHKTLAAGDLPHRIQIQRATETKSPTGEVLQAWATIVSRWAEVKPLSGNEPWIAQQATSLTTHRIKIRHLDGLTTKDRVKFGSRIFNLEAVLTPDEIPEQMQLLAIEQQPANAAEVTQPPVSDHFGFTVPEAPQV